MFTRRFTRIAFPLFVVAAGALFLAGCRGRHCCWNASPEDKADRITKRIASELGLNAAQKAKLDTIKSEILARKGEFQSIHRGIKEDFIAQIRSTAVDQEKLNKGFEDREAKMKEMRGFLVAKFAEFHASLDSAQREKLASRLEGYCR